MEQKKTKNELIKEAQVLADKHAELKGVIETALDDLDKKAEESGVTKEHLSGMAMIEEMFTELDQIELDQAKKFEEIKKA